MVKMNDAREKVVSPPFANDKMHLERFDSIQLLIVYTYLRPKVCTDCEDIFPVCRVRAIL